MPGSHHAVFQELEKLTFRELQSSERLIRVLQAKLALLDPSQFTDQQCEALARTFIAIMQDVLTDRYQDISIRAFAHICVALDYFLDPSEAIPDARVGGLQDDLTFLLKTEARFSREIDAYRRWQRVRSEEAGL